MWFFSVSSSERRAGSSSPSLTPLLPEAAPYPAYSTPQTFRARLFGERSGQHSLNSFLLKKVLCLVWSFYFTVETQQFTRNRFSTLKPRSAPQCPRLWPIRSTGPSSSCRESKKETLRGNLLLAFFSPPCAAFVRVAASVVLCYIRRVSQSSEPMCPISVALPWQCNKTCPSSLTRPALCKQRFDFLPQFLFTCRPKLKTSQRFSSSCLESFFFVSSDQVSSKRPQANENAKGQEEKARLFTS